MKGVKHQPVLAVGEGKIEVDDTVSFGVKTSPFFYSGYTYIEARRESSYITIGSNTCINNTATIISDGETISIGNDCLIGSNFQILDSDFHNLNPFKRTIDEGISRKKIVIENNVFIGNNVTVLKGVTIGENSVVANGTIVIKNIPANVIVGGGTQKIIREL